jgi:hypothetical protein
MAVNAAMGMCSPGGVALFRVFKDLPPSQCVSSTRPSIEGARAALPERARTTRML